MTGYDKIQGAIKRLLTDLPMLGLFVAVPLDPVSDEDDKPSFLNRALALNSNLPFGYEKMQMTDKSLMHVPFVNRPFESEIHGTVNFTNCCFVLLVTWRHRLRFLCHLHQNVVPGNVLKFDGYPCWYLHNVGLTHRELNVNLPN